MHILYPSDWETLSTSPQVLFFEPRPTRKLKAHLYQIREGTPISVDAAPSQTLASDTGFIRLAQWNDLIEGQYIVRIFETRFDSLIGELGFFVKSDRVKVPLESAIETIENCYLGLREARIVANGIGKSGTTWLYRLLGTLPGMQCVDMAERGYNGIDYRELKEVECGEVFHAHFRYGYEVIKTLEELDFHNVHIYRDLRDVVVSEYFHKFHMDVGNHRPDLQSKTQAQMLRYGNIWKWSSSMYAADDVLSWNRNKDCIMVKYEDLLHNTSATLVNTLQKLGFPTHECLMKYIVQKNDFTAVSGRKRGEADPRSPLRNAVAGNWRDHLEPETAERIYDQFKYYFDLFGYPK